IHVDDIDLVVQADAPDEYKTYMHRSGRTGRAGRTGRVVTLITRQRQRRMTELLGRAEIDAPFEPARGGDDVIAEIAGRMPSAARLAPGRAEADCRRRRASGDSRQPSGGGVLGSGRVLVNGRAQSCSVQVEI